MSAPVERLHPDPGPSDLAGELERQPLLALDDGAGRPSVISNFALTLDGRATIEGRSGAIGTEADTELLMRLRAAADAVMVGAGTIRAERYGRLLPREELRAQRAGRGLAPDPLAVVVSDSLELPWEAGLFSGGEGQVLIVTSSQREPPPTETPLTILRQPGGVDLAAALSTLREEHGVGICVCEGGPRLHAGLIEHDLLDELFVTVAPKLAGGEGPGLVSGLSEGDRRLELVSVSREPASGEIFTRYRRAS